MIGFESTIDLIIRSVPWKALDRHKYIGSLQEKEEPSVKYIDYASKQTMLRRGFRPGAREEFTQLLRDVSLDSNDVRGIRQVSVFEMRKVLFDAKLLSITVDCIHVFAT
jgi:hypothetical protein